MLLLDEVRDADESRIECSVVLRPDSPFVEGDRAASTLALECMAQCVAAWVGLRDHAAGQPVRVGYLVGTREVTFAVDEFRVGDELLIEATRLWGDEALGHFACAVRRGDETVAKASLNVHRSARPLPGRPGPAASGAPGDGMPGASGAGEIGGAA
jgi:predicted hotdog family 3-hydroxylacyl-ACP dehydratase